MINSAPASAPIRGAGSREASGSEHRLTCIILAGRSQFASLFNERPSLPEAPAAAATAAIRPAEINHLTINSIGPRAPSSRRASMTSGTQTRPPTSASKPSSHPMAPDKTSRKSWRRPRLVALLLGAPVLVCLLLALAPVHGQRRSKCSSARDREMDACAAKMGFLGDHSFVVPKNLSASNRFCQDLKDSVGCLQAYSRDCLQGFTKQLLTSLLKRAKQQYNLICQDDNTKRDLSLKLSCLTDDKIGQLHSCVDSSIARYEYIRGQVKPETRLPALCCSYALFNRDLDDTMERLCGKRAPAGARQARPSGADTNEFVHKVASSTAGEFFALICDNHRTLDECRQSDKTREPLKRLELISRQVKQGKLAPQGKSLIPVLLDILDSSEPI